MFRSKGSVVAAAQPVVAPELEHPRPHPLKVGAQPLGTYEALAKELNFQPAQLLEEHLLRFLAANDIQVYNYNEVDLYLGKIAAKAGKIWIWRPLREEDRQQGYWTGDSRSGGSIINDRPYPRAVPIHVLRQVKKIHDEFGSRVHFFVSDYAVPKPDPFIMVTALDVQKRDILLDDWNVARIIFNVWDEPGFGITEG